MRKILGAWLLFLMLLPVCALAEAEVWTDSEKIVLGEWICAGADVGENETVVYSMYRDGEMLFEGLPTTAGEGWYQPDEAGAYTLKAVLTDASGAVREAEKNFEVCEVPVCQLLCDKERIAFGESVQLTAQVTGGTGDFTYECAVIVENACVDRVITGEPEFSVTPAGKGQVLLQLTVTDKGGHACTAEYALTVEDAPGIGISGDTGAFHGGGGMRLWQIEAPGVWQAETDAAFIELHNVCGENGDQMAFSVEENNGKTAREGEITLRAGNLTRVVTVYQSNTFPMEREEYMDRVTDVIFVEGETLHAWSNAEGRKTFRVESNGPWTAVCDQPFVSLNLLDGELEAVLEGNDSDSVREALVVLSCGRAQATLHISQPPVFAGADVKSVRLTGENGVAYQDEAEAYVITSADAEKLVVSSDMWQEEMVLTQDQATSHQEDELIWQVTLPLRGEGTQQVLFTAQGAQGAHVKQTVSLQPQNEEADFSGSVDVEVREDGVYASVFVTRSADSMVLQDANYSELMVYTPENAFVDYAPDGDRNSRYVRWTMKLPDESHPAFLVMGEYAVGVVQEDEAEAGFALYSQQDTFWRGVKYRHSDLETSGCAIFALSHALQLLGYEGEEILPENLAKKYAFCLVEGGTLNSTLVGNAGDDLGFKTRYDLYENLSEIVDKTRQGAMWSFMVAKGHIAAVVGMSEDGKMFRIIDSAPSATFERTEKGTMYMLSDDGEYVPILDLADVPGSRFYLESSGYNGMEYWMTAEYVAKQGVRLIMPVEKE